MGRAPCCSKVGLHRGPWTLHEDTLLVNYIQTHGEGLWRSLPKKAGLLRCGKSCRLRWLNYLRPDIKRGNISPDEDELIIKLHALLGNKWSLIAGRLPGRTDNEIKNYWNTHLSKKLRSRGTDPNTHKKLSELVLVPPKRRRSNIKSKKKENITIETRNDEMMDTIRTHVYIPKPVRVKSVKRNDSLVSLESLVTNVSGEAAYWPSDGMEMMMEENDGGGLRFMIGEGDVGVHGGTENPQASDLDKLYEEYLQLLKTDDDHEYVDDNQARELESFAESLLI